MRPFNFYQYQGTGAGQFIAPFATFFTGFYFPPDLALGQNVGFIWRLFDDDITFPQTFSIKQTGKYQGGYNMSTSLGWGISGNISPLVQDSGNYAVDFSGQPVGDNYDVPVFYTDFRFDLTGNLTDLPNLFINISGQLPVTLKDTPSFFSTPYGFYNSGYNMLNNFGVSFTGSFVKKNKDTASIDVNLFQISLNVGQSQVNISTGDICSIDMAFVNIILQQG